MLCLPPPYLLPSNFNYSSFFKKKTSVLTILFASQASLFSCPAYCSNSITNYDDFILAAENGGEFYLSEDFSFDNTKRIYFKAPTLLNGKQNSLTANIRTDSGFLYISGEDSGHIGYAGDLNLKNFGIIDAFVPGQEIDTSSIVENSGIYGFKERFFTVGHRGNLGITSSLIQNNSGTTSSVFQLEDEGNLAITNSIIYSNESSSGPGVIMGWDGHVTIESSSFIENKAGGDGGVVYLGTDGRKKSSLLVSNSYFKNNEALKDDAWGGVVRATNTSSILVDSSVFDGNKAGDMGGAIYTRGVEILHIQDSQFLNNLAVNHGAALVVEDPETKVFIVAHHGDTVFSGNVLSNGSNEAIYLRSPEGQINLNAYGENSIIFDDIVRAENDADNAIKAVMNINAKGSTLLEHRNLLTQESTTDGAIIFNNQVENFDINFESGTLKLLSERSNLGLFNTSVLKINGGQRISTVDSLGLLRSVQFAGLQVNNNVSLDLDVDLSLAKSDQLEMVQGGTVEGNGKLLINQWNILNDSESELVTIAVTDQALKDYVDLSQMGTQAQGAIYTYDVSRTEEGDYLFSRNKPVPERLNPNLYGASVSIAGVGIVSHLVQNDLLKRQLLNSEKREGEELWVDLIGTNLDVNPGNFHDIDYQYGIGLLGYTTQPTQFGLGDLSVTTYIGGIYGDINFKDINISQNGVLFGFSATSYLDSLWFKAGVDFGYTSSSIKEANYDNNVHTPWYSLSLATGLDFKFSQSRISPYLILSRIDAKGDSYTTSSNVDVDLARVHITELAPGIRLDCKLSNQWLTFVDARYNFVDVSSGTQKVNGNSVGAIDFENYAEYGVGLIRASEDWSVNFSIERNSDGRQGWFGNFQSSWYF